MRWLLLLSARDGLLALGGLHRLLLLFLVAFVVEAAKGPLFLDLLGDLTVGQHGNFFGAIL